MVDTVEYQVLSLVQQREKEYGNSLEVAGGLITVWLGNRLNGALGASDVAMLMVLVKAARMTTGQFKPDTYHDLAGYGLLAAAHASQTAQETD